MGLGASCPRLPPPSVANTSLLQKGDLMQMASNTPALAHPLPWARPSTDSLWATVESGGQATERDLGELGLKIHMHLVLTRSHAGPIPHLRGLPQGLPPCGEGGWACPSEMGSREVGECLSLFRGRPGKPASEPETRCCGLHPVAPGHTL